MVISNWYLYRYIYITVSFISKHFPLATEVKVANRIWCLPPGLGVVPEVQTIFKRCIEMDGLCLRRDPITETENGFVEPKYYAVWEVIGHPIF